MSVQQACAEYHDVLDTHFAQYVWNREPAQIKLPQETMVCSEADLVEALRRYSTDSTTLQQNNSLAEFVTGIDNVKTDKPVRDFALRPADVDLDSYLARVEGANSAREWSIAYFGLHGASSVIWDQVKLFVDALAHAVGFRPGGRVDADCFIGRYSSTPSGIHVDEAHNFGFTFRSGKTMYTWPASRKELCWLKYPEYNAYKEDSHPLQNERGYVCYFPHDALHVGETRDAVSVNLNVSLWHSADEAHQHIQFVTSKLAHQAVTKNPLSRSGPIALADIDHSNIKCLRELLATGTLERQIALSRLRLQTSGGMNVPRPIFGHQTFDATKVFRVRSVATMQWYASESCGEVYIAANGHCIAAPVDSDFLPCLRAILELATDTGRTLHLSDFPRSRRAALQELLRLLHTWGAIEEVV